jgi:hypothetical protein
VCRWISAHLSKHGTARAKEKHGIDGNRCSDIPKASALLVGRQASGRDSFFDTNEKECTACCIVNFRLLSTCVYIPFIITIFTYVEFAGARNSILLKNNRITACFEAVQSCTSISCSYYIPMKDRPWCRAMWWFRSEPTTTHYNRIDLSLGSPACTLTTIGVLP